MKLFRATTQLLQARNFSQSYIYSSVRASSSLGFCRRNDKAHYALGARYMSGLSPKTVEIIKATAPVLAEHGYEITKTMYGRMLKENSDVNEMFNPSHQVILPGNKKAQQPWTLACSVHAYAANVDNLGALTEAVERIAQKHVSLVVRPDQYPIVGTNLLWAIKEVLGDAATPDIMEAWKEAYFFLADIFIKREKEIAEQKAKEIGGWLGWKEFVLTEKVQESEEICSFYFKPKDGSACPDFLPGQYTGIRMETPSFTTSRNYTLSQTPGHESLRISVKREPAMIEGAPPGQISNYLHDVTKVGDVVKLSVPCGDFALQQEHIDSGKPLVLLSGGVGITPALAIVEYLISKGVKNNIVMINNSRNPQVEPMHGLLAKYRRKHLNLVIKTLYDDGPEEYPKSPLTPEQLDSILTTRDCHYYFCGPKGFMSSVKNTLADWKIPADQVHFEFFGPHGDL